MDWKSIIKEKCQKVQRNNVRNQKNAYWFDKQNHRYSLRFHYNHSATLNALKNMKIIRSIYLYLNKNKYDIFSFSMLKFWKKVITQQQDLLGQIKETLEEKKYKFNDEQKRYICIARTTLQKYNENYGLQIGLSLHRAFGKDLALYIYDYI
jgi:hypothetical protein